MADPASAFHQDTHTQRLLSRISSDPDWFLGGPGCSSRIIAKSNNDCMAGIRSRTGSRRVRSAELTVVHQIRCGLSFLCNHIAVASETTLLILCNSSTTTNTSKPHPTPSSAEMPSRATIRERPLRRRLMIGLPIFCATDKSTIFFDYFFPQRHGMARSRGSDVTRDVSTRGAPHNHR